MEEAILGHPRNSERWQGRVGRSDVVPRHGLTVSESRNITSGF